LSRLNPDSSWTTATRRTVTFQPTLIQAAWWAFLLAELVILAVFIVGWLDNRKKLKGAT